MNLLNKLSFFALTAAVSFSACSSDPSSDPDPVLPEVSGKRYGVTVGVTTSVGSYDYILTTTDLMKQGEILSPKGAGIDITGKIDGTYGTANNGSYYTPDGSAIYKYSILQGNVKEAGNVVVTSEPWGANIMKSAFEDKSLHALGWASKYNEELEALQKDLFVIDTVTMNLLSTKKVNFVIPDNLIPDKDNPGKFVDKSRVQVSPTSMGIRNGKLYIGFNFLDPNWATPDKKVASVLIADYPSMANSKIVTNDKYGESSGSWWQSQSSFFDELGNYYFTAIKEAKYYTLLRVKAGTTEIDPDYVFDLSNYNIYIDGFGGAFDHHTYIKDGKALLGGYIFDVNKKVLVKNLDDEGLGRVQSVYADGVLVEGSYMYTFIKTADSKWYIGQYNADTNEFKRGIELDKGISTGVRLFTY